MISHSSRGGRLLLRIGWAATTRTKAKRLETCSPAGVVRQASVFQARFGSRTASARTDSGFRSGRATERRRPTVPSRSGTAKVVAVGRVGEDRRGRDLPAGRLLAELGGERRLGLKANLVGDLRLAPPLSVV